MSCTCDILNGCKGPKKLFENKSLDEPGILSEHGFRTVSDEDKAILKDALSEVQRNVSHGTGSSEFGATHGFLQELISDVVEKCHKLFTIEDMKTNVPVFSNTRTLSILVIINEVFNDIGEHTLTDLQ